MKRRDFLGGASAAAGAAALTGCGRRQGGGPAGQAGQRVQWRLASSFPRSLDVLFGAAETLAQRVDALSGGLFKIQVYSAGELVPGLQVMDAVQQGSVQVGQTVSYYYTGKNAALSFDVGVPFGMSARQQAAWLREGGGLQLLREIYADFNIVNFPAGSTGAQMGGWFRREVSTLEDLRGLKIRVPGMGGEVMSRLGATVQVLAGGDIFPALERGAIDATEWVGPYDDEKLGFFKVAKNYYYPGFWEPGPSLSLLVHKPAWEKLPATYQEIFQAAVAEAGVIMQARYDQKNPEALGRLLAQGVVLKAFPDDILRAALKATTELLEEQAGKDPRYRKIYDHYRKARADMFRWFATSELAFANFAFREPT